MELTAAVLAEEVQHAFTVYRVHIHAWQYTAKAAAIAEL
jgi:hypothetical protein